MLKVLQIVSVVLVAFVMTPPMAHALELPGKMRLSKKAYLMVQPIYYPGFTIAGIAEPVALIVLLLLVCVTRLWTTAFWFALASLIALFLMHFVYWVLTHPVNNFWLADFKLSRFGAAFFGSNFGHDKVGRRSAMPDWKLLRNRWEYSHVARAGLGLLSLILIVVAVLL